MDKVEHMCRQRFNELVMVGTDLGRLIGYSEDVLDCYLVVKKLDGKITHATACGGYVFLSALKEQGVTHANNGEIWTDYSRLNGDVIRAGLVEEKEFIFEPYLGNPLTDDDIRRFNQERDNFVTEVLLQDAMSGLKHP